MRLGSRASAADSGRHHVIASRIACLDAVNQADGGTQGCTARHHLDHHTPELADLGG